MPTNDYGGWAGDQAAMADARRRADDARRLAGGSRRELLTQLIVELYESELGRQPNEAELQGHIDNPDGEDGIRAAISGSQEATDYRNRASDPDPDPDPEVGDNPFESDNPEPEDAAVYAMIQRDQASWLGVLTEKAKALGFADPAAEAQDAVNGMISQLRLSSNQRSAVRGDVGDPQQFLTEAVDRLTSRGGQNTGAETNVPGMPRGSASQSFAPPTAGPGSNDPPKPTPTPTPTPYVARPTTPYSARAYVPTQAATNADPAPIGTYTPSAQTPQPQSQVPPFVGNMGNMTGQTSTQPPVTAAVSPEPRRSEWDRVDMNYQQAGNDYAAGPNGAGFSPEPWAQSRGRWDAPMRRSAAMGYRMNRGGGVPRGTDSGRAERDPRRATRFSQQNEQTNRDNMALGQDGFNNQMNTWLRAYNQWNQRVTPNVNRQPRGDA